MDKQTSRSLIDKKSPSPIKMKRKTNLQLDSGEESAQVTPFGGDDDYVPADKKAPLAKVLSNKGDDASANGDQVAPPAPAFGSDVKMIDFHEKLLELKRTSMVDLPYTITQVEDAMYLDSQNVITLEYHYYQDDCKYTKLQALNEHIDVDGKIVDENGKPVLNMLATEQFQQNHIHPMSGFSRELIINYQDDATNNLNGPGRGFTIVEGQVIENTDVNQSKKDKNKKQAILKSDDQYLEVVVALWKVNSKGQMTRKLQAKDVHIERKFFPSEHGNMTLTRSSDKKIVSLVNFDREDKNNQYFKIYAWNPKALDEIKVEDELTEGMNRYFNVNKENFHELVEVSFVYKGEKVLLKYIEMKQRSLIEQQEAEIKLESYRKKNVSSTAPQLPTGLGTDQQQNFEKRYKPRHAIKYVFFDAHTGEVDFEYGGFREPLFLETINNDSAQIYQIGVLVKEIREMHFAPYLTIFFVGDFMEKAIKDNQILMKWACANIDIDMKELLEYKTQELKILFINSQIQKHLVEKRTKFVNYYAFDQNWIEQNKYDWEINISVTANKNFQQIGLINMPQDKAFGAPCVFIHGPRFVNYLNPNQPQSDQLMLSNPYYIHLPFDVYVKFSRNQNIKDQIFYDVIKNGEVKTMCIRVDDENQVNAININITANNYISERDCWMQYHQITNPNQESDSDVYQTIHVTQGDQYAKLISRNMFINPLNHCCSTEQQGLIFRQSNQYQQLISDHPFIAYNLGDSKIILQNTLMIDERRCYILDLPEEEKFVSFVKFNQFEDIGFYHSNIRIECCSHFLFMTTPKRPKDGCDHNKLNLLFIDPYCRDVQTCLFRSKTYFDNEIFLQNDFLISSIIQSTMGKKRDTKFKTYIWTQFETILIRSRMLRNDQEEEDMVDSDESERHEKVVVYEDEFELNQQFRLLPMPLMTNDKGFMYYIMKKNGKCYIFEGNPRDQYLKNHQVVFKLKAEKCLSFSIEHDIFYFMNENHVVFTLTRNDNNRFLTIQSECTMKEIQRTDFKPRLYDSTILKDKYAIQGSKIFFLYNLAEDPFPEGIYESEDLFESQFTSKPIFEYIKGPFMSKGSNRFFNIYRINKFKSKISLFDLPDSVQKILINDFQNKTDMSTYVEGGKILVKVFKRFMVFTQKGEFVDEVEFQNLDYITSEESQIDQLAILERIVSKPIFDSAVSGPQKKQPQIQIYDFMGNNYKFKSPEPKQIINQVNKMRMFQMSKNNKFFVFNDSISNKIFLYQLKICQKSCHFELVYEIQVSKSFLFCHMYTIQIQPIEYFYNNRSQIKVDDDGQVSMCYVQNLPFVEDGAGSDDEFNNGVQMIQCRLLGSIFKQDGKSFGSKCENFSQLFDFPRYVQLKMASIIQDQIRELEMRIRQIWNKQKRLPPSLFDYQEYENLIEDLQDLENKRSDVIFAKLFTDNLVVIFSGQCLKYGRLIKNKNKQILKGELAKKEMDITFDKEDGKHILQDIDLQLSDNVEIIKIIETVNTNWLQIVAIEHKQNLVFIITWDFENNMEQTNLQLRIEQACDVGNHVVCGMNQKMNYLINKHQLIDLEYGIPVRQVNVDQDLDTSSISYTKQVNFLTDLFTQRKVYQDNQVFLGVEKPSAQYYEVSQMDILFWQNIVMLGEKKDLIDQTCKLRQLNLVVNGYSLFHYFSANADIIECILDKFIMAKQNNIIEEQDEMLPLQICNPDNNGRTALFLAIANQSPRSFEYMVRLLSDFPDICISKMILKSYTMILQYDSPIVINFFETGGVFQPPQMQEQQFVPWADDLAEVIFCSHTAIISPQLLRQKLREEGIDLGDAEEDDSGKESNQLDDNGEVKEHLSREAKILLQKSQMRGFNLITDLDSMPDQNLRRVSVFALDMDWIFFEDNAKTLLSILADTQNEKVLTKKSIQIFIRFMWKKFQPAIIKRIFIPYMLYLVQLILLSGLTIRKYNEMFDDDQPEQELLDQQNKFWWLSILAACETFGSMVILLYFVQIESSQMWSLGFSYLSEFWNFIDSSSMLLSMTFLSLFIINQVYQDVIFTATLINTIAAFGQFLMWIKIFYWMRLFPSLAYYVKLIFQTLTDCLPFDLMVLIIMIAFSNFFYVLNGILREEDPNLNYWDRHTENDAVDSFIMIFLAGSVGNFYQPWYGQGKVVRYFAASMFVLAVFFIKVVFMNMLVAILGQTYGEVSSQSEESGLREQVQLIADHEYILNLQEIFKGQKYIMIMQQKSSSGDKSGSETKEQVVLNANIVNASLDRFNTTLNKTLDAVDTNTQHVLKLQFGAIRKVQMNVKSLDNIINEEVDKKKRETMAEDEMDSPEPNTVAKQDDQQMMALLNAVNAQYSQHQLTLENIQDLAMNWMDIADTDGNGELDFEEFCEFFQSIDCITLSQQDLRRIFSEFDTSGNQYLSLEEFASALYKTFLIDQQKEQF